MAEAEIFASKTEIIKKRDAVGLRPDPDFPRILEGVVVPFKGFLAIEGDDKMASVEIHFEGMPLIGGHFHFCPFLLGAFSFDGVIDGFNCQLKYVLHSCKSIANGNVHLAIAEWNSEDNSDEFGKSRRWTILQLER